VQGIGNQKQPAAEDRTETTKDKRPRHHAGIIAQMQGRGARWCPEPIAVRRIGVSNASGADLPAPVGFENPAIFARRGVFFRERHMDREEGFPTHVIGFMKRKREREKLDNAKAVTTPTSDDRARPTSNP